MNMVSYLLKEGISIGRVAEIMGWPFENVEAIRTNPRFRTHENVSMQNRKKRAREMARYRARKAEIAARREVRA